MNTVLKTILFLGLAAALLFMPMTAAADENIQDPPSVALAETRDLTRSRCILYMTCGLKSGYAGQIWIALTYACREY